MKGIPDTEARVAVKLGSLVVHCQEATSPDHGHQLDVEAVRALATDPDVADWLARFDPVLLPVRR